MTAATVSNAPSGVRETHSAFYSRFARRTWLFDLDNTLHDAGQHIFPQIGRSMMAYICRHLEVDEAEATRLRQKRP